MGTHLRSVRARPTRSLLLVLSLLVALVGASQLTSCDGFVVYPLPTANAVNDSSSTTTDIGPAQDPILDRSGPPLFDPTGAFRTNCTWSHYSYDDPIVWPGQANKAHAHAFFGNRQMDYATTDPLAGTSSTCSGGLANRTGYWVPAMVTNTVTGPTQVVPAGFYNHPTDPTRQWAANTDHLQAYYKTGYRGASNADVQPFPPGLKMIAGNVPFGEAAPTDEVWWTCQDTPQVDGSLTRHAGIPDCDPGKIVQLAIEFPQCGAVDAEGDPLLDSANHRSHMAYAEREWGWRWTGPGPTDGESYVISEGCPSSHPNVYPEITEFIRWQVPFSEDPMLSDTSNWRLSSDRMAATETMPEMFAPAGTTAHADWWNGWNPNVLERIVTQCLNPGLDCQMNNIGDDPTVAGTLLERLLD